MVHMWRTFNSFDGDCSWGISLADDTLSIGFQDNSERSFAQYVTQHQPANVQGGPKQVNHYQESPLDRIKNRQCGYSSLQFCA